MGKFKGYDVVNFYPEDGWLKGYFYVSEEDIKLGKERSSEAYRDLSCISHKDYILHLLNVKKEDKILDVGCSNGAMTVYCGLLGAEVYGIDISLECIEKANKYLSKYGIKGKAVLGDARKINFPDNYFDKAISSDFFEHLNYEDNILALKEIKRVLKPGGMLVIKTPNLTYLHFSKFVKQMKRIIKLKNPFDIIIPHTMGDNPQHIGLVTRSKMIRIIKSAGFMNFKFYYPINFKIERLNYFLGEFFAESYFLRDIVSEELIVVIYKPIILSFFP